MKSDHTEILARRPKRTCFYEFLSPEEKERIRKVKKKWFENNREKQREYGRKWRKKNPERWAEIVRKSRARRKERETYI